MGKDKLCCRKVKLRVKKQPWFVSDTMPQDISWSLAELESAGGELSQLGLRWRSYLSRDQWTVSDDQLWTLPHCYHQMLHQDPQLYNQLSQDKLIIFKGDLNYRKLVGDLNWPTTVSFSEALQGFHPSNVLTIR